MGPHGGNSRQVVAAAAPGTSMAIVACSFLGDSPRPTSASVHYFASVLMRLWRRLKVPARPRRRSTGQASTHSRGRYVRPDVHRPVQPSARGSCRSIRGVKHVSHFRGVRPGIDEVIEMIIILQISSFHTEVVQLAVRYL